MSFHLSDHEIAYSDSEHGFNISEECKTTWLYVPNYKVKYVCDMCS